MSHIINAKGSDHVVNPRSSHDLRHVAFPLVPGHSKSSGNSKEGGSNSCAVVITSCSKQVGSMGKHAGDIPNVYHRINQGKDIQSSVESIGNPMACDSTETTKYSKTNTSTDMNRSLVWRLHDITDAKSHRVAVCTIHCMVHWRFPRKKFERAPKSRPIISVTVCTRDEVQDLAALAVFVGTF
jgi:hypothetical protein